MNIGFEITIEACLGAIIALLFMILRKLKEYQSLREVVLCENCRHRVHDEERNLYYCEMYYGQGDVSDGNFCQWGERREDESNTGT